MAIETGSIHPTAHIDPTAEIGEGVIIEPHAFVGPGCIVGAGTRLMIRSIVLENTTLGSDNVVHPYAVLGGDPQDVKFDRAADPGRLEIGDGNTFREGVTLSRGAGPEGATRVGANCYFMAGSHAGHNAKVGDRVIVTNGAALAGHVWADSGCVISAHSVVHQFVRIGRNSMLQGLSRLTMHAPPFSMVCGLNGVTGLNRVGLRRALLSDEERRGFRMAHDLFYRRRSNGEATMADGLREAEAMVWPGASREYIDFIRWALDQPAPRNRGLARPGRGTDIE